MEKLELKHLAPYLPYGLKYLYMKKGEAKWMDSSINHYHTILSYCEKGYHSKSSVGVTMFYDGVFDKQIILRPLSDLTKEIEGIGIPIYELNKTRGVNCELDNYSFYIDDKDFMGIETTSCYGCKWGMVIVSIMKKKHNHFMMVR